MRTRLFPALALSAVLAAGIASATDTSSLGSFLATCSADVKGCKGFAHDLIISARNANYGCIPKELSTDAAAERELAWLRHEANGNPKYQGMSLEDVMWAGVDELWPCSK